jgi:hypothetical protein
VLQVLDEQHYVSLEALEKTKIGVIVNRTAKQYDDKSQIRKLARGLVKKWKENAKAAVKRRDKQERSQLHARGSNQSGGGRVVSSTWRGR